MSKPPYIGRFAPSPSGPLHLGSLMSATCSYLQAKANKGKWLLRIEDVDTPRVVKGAAETQIKQLESFGFVWDDDILYQSSRFNHYDDIIHKLIIDLQIYACECTRKHLKETAESSEMGFIYPRICTHKNLSLSHHALRLKTINEPTTFIDKVYGEQIFNIQQLSSDWIIKRADGIFAYHLAVVLDDAIQGVTEVVRGFDILPLTPLHIELQKQLKLPIPSYCHHPLIEQHGRKLSKQNHADSVSKVDRIKTLNSVLKALGQLEILEVDNLDDYWKIAIAQWDVNLIPTQPFSIR